MERGGTRRDAIVEAMIRVAGRQGYLATSVADVMAEAGVSRTTFYKHFGNKQECFLAAYDLAVERLAGATEEACAGPRPWRERAREALTAVVDTLATDPALAHTAIVEISTAGVEGRRRQSASASRFAALLRPDAAEAPGDLPANAALMAVGAVTGLIFDQLQEGRAESLPRIRPDLEFALLVPYLGPRVAAEAFAAPAADSR